MERELIGTFRINEDQKRVKYAECARYDEWREVKAGDYPVYLYTESCNCARTAMIVFDKDFSEIWHGFNLGENENFRPGDGWEVKKYTFTSIIDGSEIPTADIARV